MASENLEQLGRRYASSKIKEKKGKITLKNQQLKIHDLTQYLFYSHRSAVPDTDLHGSIESEAHKWTSTFTHSRSSFLHHRRHTSQISRYLGNRASPTIWRGRRTILLRGWFEMRSRRRSPRADNGSRRGYREDAAISGRGEADQKTTS